MAQTTNTTPERSATVVKLTRPVPWFDGQTITQISLREPSGRQYVKLGDPRVLVWNASGGGYWVEQPEVVAAYLEVCIAEDSAGAIMGAQILDRLALEDVMGVKAALFDFFDGAAKRRFETNSMPRIRPRRHELRCRERDEPDRNRGGFRQSRGLARESRTAKEIGDAAGLRLS